MFLIKSIVWESGRYLGGRITVLWISFDRIILYISFAFLLYRYVLTTNSLSVPAMNHLCLNKVGLNRETNYPNKLASPQSPHLDNSSDKSNP